MFYTVLFIHQHDTESVRLEQPPPRWCYHKPRFGPEYTNTHTHKMNTKCQVVKYIANHNEG